MQWTMPPRVLQIVASLIGLAAAASFVMGIMNAPQRGGRLPGEKVPGAAAGAPAIDATDATPLADERIQGPPPPTNEESKDDETTTEADAGNTDNGEAAAAETPNAGAANTQTAQALRPPAPPAAAPPQTLGGPPAPDEPPH